MRIFNRIKGESNDELEGFRKIIDTVRVTVGIYQDKSRDELNKAISRKKMGDLKGALLCMKKRKLYEKTVLRLERSFMSISDQELESAYEDKKNDKIMQPLALSSNTDDELLNELNDLETKQNEHQSL